MTRTKTKKLKTMIDRKWSTIVKAIQRLQYWPWKTTCNKVCHSTKYETIWQNWASCAI